jgi:hypothetical protein
MITVWIWDADGPSVSASGVTDDEDAARHAAEAGMTSAGAVTATVEAASHLGGGGWMEFGYARRGYGWAAHRHDGQITWTQFSRPLKRIAS